MEIIEEIRKCDICGCEKYTELWRKPPWTRTNVIKFKSKVFHSVDVICDNCGVIYKNPMMSRESMSDFYQGAHLALYEPINITSISGRSIAQRVVTTVYCLDWLNSIGYHLPGKRVFEVGCGFGTLLVAIRGFGTEITGIESGKRSCEIANKIFGFKPIHMKFEELDISDLYDLVIINNTLEHFYSPTEALEKAKTMLLPGGKILVEIPSMWYPYPGINIDGFLSSAHNFTFSFDSFTYLANKCGLVIEDMGYRGHKKCVFFLLSPNTLAKKYLCGINITGKDIIAKLLKRYHEVDTFVDDIGDQVKFTKDMKGMGCSEMNSKYPNHTNVLGISYINWLLTQGKVIEVIDFFESPNSIWKDNQSEDENVNPGTFDFLHGLTYRYLGDFLTAKKYYKKALLQYPRLDRYNFISDMVINGLIPENIFSATSWYNCKRALENS